MELDIANVEFQLKIYIKLDFEDIKFYTELKFFFFKLSLKNRSILLYSFKILTFYYIICKLRANIHFSQHLFHCFLFQSMIWWNLSYLLFRHTSRQIGLTSFNMIMVWVPQTKPCKWAHMFWVYCWLRNGETDTHRKQGPALLHAGKIFLFNGQSKKFLP